MKNKLLCLIFSFFILFDLTFAKEVDIDIKSEKYILYNMNNNEVLLEKDSNEKTYIASLTKIMSSIVAIENISDYDKKVTLTSKMLSNIDYDVAVVGFKSGQTVTINDLLYGTLLYSGGDAIQSLAYYVRDDLDDFVSLMNEKVKELGLKNTHFSNVIGLTSEDNYSSAYDMAQILKYALKNEKFHEVFTTKTYELSIGKTISGSVYSYSKVTSYDISFISGAKTGYTKASGYCLATIATINDIDYLLITLNAYNNDIKAVHVRDAYNIYNYYKKNYGIYNYVDEGDIVVKLSTRDAKSDEVSVKSDVSKSFYTYNDFDKDEIVYEYNGVEDVSYFTKKGSVLGTINVLYKGSNLGTFDVLYDGSLEFSLFDFIKNRWYIFIILGVLITILKKK